MKKTLIPFLLLFLFLMGCSNKNKKDEIKEFTGSRIVETIKVESTEVASYIEMSGKLEAEAVVNYSPTLPLRIKKIHVEEGDRVDKGNLLLELDDKLLLQAEAQYRNMQANYSRMLELKKTGSVDQKSFDEVETAFLVAKAAYESVQENTRLIAPFAGVVTFIALKEGDTYNNMFDPVLLRLLNLENMKVRLQVSDIDLKKLRTGQKAVIQVDSASQEEITGEVSFISSEADKYSGLFQVEIKVKNRANILKHNQFARIRILTGISRKTLVVPQKAIVDDRFVFTVREGKAQRKEIITGIGNEEEIEIKSGLEAGEEVIVIGNVGLLDGDPVQVKE
ncbi:MAG: efflux RND transporter periplasmic adaptor subunit [Candidatus Cloacimonetes bacterium]|nr:efflux RND transporter periplasmic adaptor subunit [Candidatus Cloacimonadota bacterium]